MEAFAVMVITVPIVTPLVLSLGYDLVWWGIIMLIVVEVGMIHPPLGLNVFVLKSITPDVPLWTIYKGVMPFAPRRRNTVGELSFRARQQVRHEHLGKPRQEAPDRHECEVLGRNDERHRVVRHLHPLHGELLELGEQRPVDQA